MSVETIKLTGKASWAKIYERNRDINEAYHGAGGAYTIDVLLEKEELDKLTASGSRLKPRLSDEGISIKFKRKHVHPAGIEALGGPPQVVDAEGNEWDKYLGNGSTVTVAVDVYDTKMGKGTRLTGVKVLEYVAPPEPEEGEGGAPSLPF